MQEIGGKQQEDDNQEVVAALNNIPEAKEREKRQEQNGDKQFRLGIVLIHL
jgi:hypothetical protein